MHTKTSNVIKRRQATSYKVGSSFKLPLKESEEEAVTTSGGRQFQIGTTLIANDKSRTNLGIIEWDGMFMSELRRRMRSKERTWNDGMIV